MSIQGAKHGNAGRRQAQQPLKGQKSTYKLEAGFMNCSNPLLNETLRG